MIKNFKIFETQLINNIVKILYDIIYEFNFFDIEFNSRFNYYVLSDNINHIFCYIKFIDKKIKLYDIENNEIEINDLDTLKEKIIYCFILEKISDYDSDINVFNRYNLNTFKNLDELISYFMKNNNDILYKIYNKYLFKIKYFEKYNYLFNAKNFDLI